MGDSVQRAVAQTALVEVGAVGLGALLVKVLALTVADVTGVLAAGAVAALGFYIIPNKRRRAKLDLQDKINDLRERLGNALTGQFEAELTRSLANIRDGDAPLHPLRRDAAGVAWRNRAGAADGPEGDLQALAARVGELDGEGGPRETIETRFLTETWFLRFFDFGLRLLTRFRHPCAAAHL